MNCFPIAVQSSHTQDRLQTQPSLLGELAGNVLDFATEFLSRLRLDQADTQTETQKLALARNQETPAAVLLALSDDASSAIRNELIFNPAVPASVLFKLAGDSDRFIAAQAQSRISRAA